MKASDISAKVERAKRHLGDLEADRRAYLEADPYRAIRERDPETDKMVVRLRIDPPIPTKLSLILGDVAHNLRTALDYLACHLVETNRGTVTDRTAFPVWRKNDSPTTAELGGLVKDKLAGASPTAIAAVIGLEPHEGGAGHQLWTVNEIDRLDKHQLLPVLGIDSGSVGIDVGDIIKNARLRRGDLDLAAKTPSFIIGLNAKPEDRFVENGDVLFSWETEPPGGYHDTQFRLDIALGEPRALRGEPLLPALGDLVKSIEDVIEQLLRLT